MTREEEVQIASVENANKRLTEITNLDFAISAKADYDNGLTQGFKDGANWADKHPKRYNQDELCDIQLEMMKQRDKRLIAKACEWLKENIDIYAKVVINHKSNYPEIVMCDTFEKNFIKAMER